MIIIPAIDIKQGKVVRLYQGDFNQVSTYGLDPVVLAKNWQKQGAKMLHVVDLDGAKTGKMKNLKLIKKMLKQVNIPIQVGGGIRSLKIISTLLKQGVSRVVLGTAALEDKTFLGKALAIDKTSITVSLDTRNGKLVTRGWKSTLKKDLISTAKTIEKQGVKRVIFTDAKRDGTLTSPNYCVARKLITSLTIPIIIGGGITTKSQVKRLKRLGIEAVIVGKALYEKKFSLGEVQDAN